MDIKQIKEFFDKDEFAKMSGAVIEGIGEGGVICTLGLKKHHLNAGGIVQGGAIFTLADFAFAVASNLEDLKADQRAITVNQSCNMVFFRPAKGDKLIATAACLHKGHKMSVYRVLVTDNTGLDVAEMTGNAYRVVK